MLNHTRVLGSLARAALVSFAVAAAGCSFQNTKQVRCTQNSDCVEAFGTGAVCQSDGFCTGGTAGGTDSGGSGDGGDNSGPWTFVSFPDFLNADIGDVSSLTTAVNSTNTAHEAAIDAVLSAMAAEKPDFVLVAGDLVNGHWYADASGVQVFGPVGTLDEKKAAITKAANLYYSQWKKRFADRDLTVYAALGDHDVGDNNWPANQDKAFLVPHYKQEWAKHFTLDENGNPLFAQRPVGTAYEHTAYAVRHKNVLIVTTDVFRQDDPTMTIDSKTGSVRTEVSGGQLAWLDSLLASAAEDPQIDHVIVQGHVPVLVPVRQRNSSGLTIPGAGSSQFWQTLAKHKVDLYFAGEVHDMSTSNYLGVEQVVHGGIMGYATKISYLVGRVYPERIELELKSADLEYPANDTTRLWQAGSNRPRAQYSISANGFMPAGSLVIDKSSGATEYVNRSGYFIPLNGAASGLAVHLPLDEPGGNMALNHGSTGTINNGLIEGARFVAGKLGNALSFDNEGDKVVAGVPPTTAAKARTASIWVRVGPSATETIRTAFTFGTNMPGGKWDVDVDATGLFELGVGQGRTDATGTTPLTDNAWHHLVTVLPQGATALPEVKMYLDGNPITFSAATTAIATTTGNILLGRCANTNVIQQFTGLLDDFAIWAEELPAGHVRALYSLGNESALAYDASDVNALFEGFKAKQDVVVNGRLWRYQASGITSTLGQVTATGGGYAINLGGGAGFVSQ